MPDEITRPTRAIRCPSCDGTNHAIANGVLTCADCGTPLESRPPASTRWQERRGPRPLHEHAADVTAARAAAAMIAAVDAEVEVDPPAEDAASDAASPAEGEPVGETQSETQAVESPSETTAEPTAPEAV